MSAGIAAKSPRAVATKASEIPGATAFMDTWESCANPLKAFITPQTVPNRPINGLVDATVDKKDKPSSKVSSCLLIMISVDLIIRSSDFSFSENFRNSSWATINIWDNPKIFSFLFKFLNILSIFLEFQNSFSKR